MKNFFILFWKRGLQILFLILLIWIFYFILNFMFPHMFDFLRGTGNNLNSNSTSSLVNKNNLSWRGRLYNTFFASRANKNYTLNSDSLATSTYPKKPSYWDGSSTSSYVWGSEGGSWGGSGTNRLKPTDLYIYPNLNNSIAQNLRINNILIKKDLNNILVDGNIISGDIAKSYLSQYFFNIDIYNSAGDYIFSIGANAYTDLKDKDTLHFSAIYRDSQNLSGYKGNGFMVIRTDNTKVDGILIINIRIE
jgi:hypothetical protein